MPTEPSKPRLILLGYGNMGRAIAAGMVRAGTFEQAAIIAIDPAPHTGDIPAFADLASLGPLTPADTLILAVKPQVFPLLAPSIAGALAPLPSSVLVISIMAGVPGSTIAATLGPNARIIRAMPNTPAQIGQGTTACALGPRATEHDARAAATMLAALGPLVIRTEESLIDAFTAVAGSGPAYLFYLAEAMTSGAIAAGIEPATAALAVRQTLFGAAAMLNHHREASPADLRARVTSKGGTTQAAINILEQRSVGESIAAAINAAHLRAQELSR